MEKINNNKKVIIISTIMIFLPLIVSLFIWNRLPEQIPTHWNAAGEVDSYSSKTFALLGLPLFMVAVHGLCIWATTADPKHKGISDSAFKLVLFICPVLNILITYMELSVAFGREINVPRLMNIFMGILFIIIGNYLPKSRRNYTMGIKVPWALNSDDNWNATHRVGGIAFIVAGVLSIVLAFLPANFTLLSLVALTGAGIVPTLYSYLYYLRNESKKE